MKDRRRVWEKERRKRKGMREGEEKGLIGEGRRMKMKTKMENEMRERKKEKEDRRRRVEGR